jgi:hypothetical protein
MRPSIIIFAHRKIPRQFANIIQSGAYSSCNRRPWCKTHLNARDRLIVQEDLKHFPQDQQIISRGFTLLKAGRNDHHLLDPSGLFEGVPDTYFDVGHLTKVGNALLGKYIHDAVAESAREGDIRQAQH